VCRGFECAARADLRAARMPLTVVQANDAPEAEWLEVPPPPPRTKWTRRVPHSVLIGHAASLSQVIARPEEPLELQLRGLDASPDGRIGWVEWGTLGQGAGQGSLGGLGPSGLSRAYAAGDRDPLGSPDEEPDAELTAEIVSEPDVPPPPLVLSGHAASLTPY
jgi:hypothetical protein